MGSFPLWWTPNFIYIILKKALDMAIVVWYYSYVGFERERINYD